ncbi:RloB family protein [Mammaliicoccus sciuri]|uniref:RloB family protein n=1 Tax=Mammaliicoccus sciuri TaxID=1296 RepID=UPI002B258D18|nr:RloB family protein [Mammaliicoccus sciuri]WQL16940.1 RloB family protein [Mammaliicoccus sciuri]
MPRNREPKGKKINRKTTIYCEGYTEKHYLMMLKNKYKKSNIKIDIKSMHKSCCELVKKAENTEKTKSSDRVYIIFDKDSHQALEIGNAIKDANKNDFTVIYSNNSFELWLLSHFNPITGPINNNDLNRKLEKELNVSNWKKYKNEKFKNIETQLVDKVTIAYDNIKAHQAEKKDVNYNGNNINIINKNPYTNIHMWIKEIYNVDVL